MSGDKGPYHSMLINDSGHTTAKAVQSQPTSATTASRFTPSGQYFVLDHEHSQA